MQIRETTGFERTFFAHTSQKNPEIRQVFPDFSILSGRKISRSKLLCTQKVIFLCRARRKAQEYWICIPSIFNEVRREKNLFALPYPYSARPKRGALFNLNEMFGMKENLIPVDYKVESEAYRALSEMKRETTNANCTISQAVIIKK